MDDATLLSSTLVRVHEYTEGWETGRWETEDTDTTTATTTRHGQDETDTTGGNNAVIEKRRRFSLVTTMTSSSCCGNIDDIDDHHDHRRGSSSFLPYKLSRRRSSLRMPKLEIECTLKDDDDKRQEEEETLIDTAIPIKPLNQKSLMIDPSLSISPSHHPCMSLLPPPTNEWKYSPLLLVPTPGSGMIIQRIRRANELDGRDNIEHNPSFVQLPINNGKEMDGWVIDFITPNFQGTALFRIRNSLGTEQQQQAQGQAHTGMTSKSSKSKSSSPDYFANYNRKFQMVIRGKFLHPINMADCMSGLMLDRPLRTAGSVITDPLLACADMSDTPGIVNTPTTTTTITTPSSNSHSQKYSYRRKLKKQQQESLPPKWVLRASVKIAGLFSPRMDADLECLQPRILTPLCSVAQTVQVARTATSTHNGEECCPDLMKAHVEPHHGSKHSLVHELKQYKKTVQDHTTSSSVQIRKKTFDSIYDARLSNTLRPTPQFDTDATYTFEFLQHLIDYNDFSLDFGSIVGKMKLGGALKGQPCRFVAGIVNREKNEQKGCSTALIREGGCLWSFDLWHESLGVRR